MTYTRFHHHFCLILYIIIYIREHIINIAVDEVMKGESFMRLLEASVLLYWAELWRCCRQTDPLVQVQLRAARVFLGVGRLHPRSAIIIEYEMTMMPLVWEAKRRMYWIKVLKVKESRWVN